MKPLPARPAVPVPGCRPGDGQGRFRHLHPARSQDGRRQNRIRDGETHQRLGEMTLNSATRWASYARYGDEARALGLVLGQVLGQPL